MYQKLQTGQKASKLLGTISTRIWVWNTTCPRYTSTKIWAQRYLSELSLRNSHFRAKIYGINILNKTNTDPVTTFFHSCLNRVSVNRDPNYTVILNNFRTFNGIRENDNPLFCYIIIKAHLTTIHCAHLPLFFSWEFFGSSVRTVEPRPAPTPPVARPPLFSPHHVKS